MGGLVGANPGTVTNSYWDTTSSGMTTGIGGGTTTGATGLTSAQAMMQASYTGFDFASTWRIYEGNTRPLLKSFLTPLTVTANNATVTYNGTTSFSGLAVTYSVAGAGSSPNLLGTLTLTHGGPNAGTTALTPSGLYSNQQGFDISFISGTLTITKANLSVTANGVTKTFDGVAYSGGGGVIYSGFVSGETEAVLGGTLAFGGSSQGAVNPGNYVIAPGGLTSGNYAISYIDGTLTIGAPAQPYIPPPEPRNPLTSPSQPSSPPLCNPTGGGLSPQALISWDGPGGGPPSCGQESG